MLAKKDDRHETKLPRKFAALVSGMAPEAQKEARDRATATLQQMALHELRKARRRTQREVALDMNVAQSEISKIEQRSDLRLGTLNSYVQALGGTLQVRAVFPESSIELVVAQVN